MRPDLDDARLERHGPLLVWRLSDDRLIPVPAGAAGDDDSDDDDDDSEDDDSDSEGDDDSDSEDENDVEKVRAALAKERADRRDADKRARKAERRVAELDKAAKTKPKDKPEDDGVDVEARIQAARDEERQAHRREMVAARVEALAGGLLADPTDAPLHLAEDLDDLVDDRGRPDRDAIRRAIKDLLEDKPHLAKPAGTTADDEDKPKRRPRGAADQGARSGDKRSVHDRAKERAERMKTLR